MKCPFCNQEMSAGHMTSGRYILWKEENAEGRNPKEYLLAKSYMSGAKLGG